MGILPPMAHLSTPCNIHTTIKWSYWTVDCSATCRIKQQSWLGIEESSWPDSNLYSHIHLPPIPYMGSITNHKGSLMEPATPPSPDDMPLPPSLLCLTRLLVVEGQLKCCLFPSVLCSWSFLWSDPAVVIWTTHVALWWLDGFHFLMCVPFHAG